MGKLILANLVGNIIFVTVAGVIFILYTNFTTDAPKTSLAQRSELTIKSQQPALVAQEKPLTALKRSIQIEPRFNDAVTLHTPDKAILEREFSLSYTPPEECSQDHIKNDPNQFLFCKEKRNKAKTEFAKNFTN